MDERNERTSRGSAGAATAATANASDAGAHNAEAMEREIVITRVFDAPRELVFKAWIDPEHLKMWWGPHGFTSPMCQVDARVGGSWKMIMRAPNGAEFPCDGVYREVVPPERLVFTNDAVDQNGNVMIEGFTTVIFEDQNGRTKLTLRTRGVGKVPYAPKMLAGMETGWTQSLERLEKQVTRGGASNTADREIVISRVFDAPREMVFDAFTNPEHVGKWWGPNGFTTTTQEIDIRPGGVWRFIMHGPDGTNYDNHIVYDEIVKPDRIVYMHGPAPKFQSTITFSDQAGKTKVTLRIVLGSAAEREVVAKYAVEGGRQHLGNLAEFLNDKYEPLVIALPSDREFVLTRVFDAPRKLVWEAMSKCEHIKRWWGPRGTVFTACEMDFRPGGAWRHVVRVGDGPETVFKGVYRELLAPERIVSTECFDEPKLGSPEWLSTVTLEEHDGKTTMTSRVLHPSVEARDGHLGSGMEAGATQTFERLAELLSEMSAGT